jgi:ABC-type glutathione transport system ATPase component
MTAAAETAGRDKAHGAPLLEIAGLTVRLYVDGIRRAVLRDVSFEVRPGEALGLVGESGSGKSMTARAIDRLLPPGAQVDGTITFDGQDVGALSGARLRAYRHQVAMVFQDPRVHVNPVRRIGDFMTEALRTNLGLPVGEARHRAITMLGQVGIEDGDRRAVAVHPRARAARAAGGGRCLIANPVPSWRSGRCGRSTAVWSRSRTCPLTC